jgi:hypothetical protein
MKIVAGYRLQGQVLSFHVYRFTRNGEVNEEGEEKFIRSSLVYRAEY